MISTHIQKAIERVRTFAPVDIYAEDQGPLISVNTLTTKAGNVYEKLRYMVDYKEEHTIRRSAVERILKRSLTMNLTGASEKVGGTLVQELVSARYLPNNRVSEQAIVHVQGIIDKYMQLRKESGIEQNVAISFAATEIDRLLFPQIVNEAVVTAFYETILPYMNYDVEIDRHVFEGQVYIACRRSLLADDPEMLLYALVLRDIPPLAALSGNSDEITTISARFKDVVEYAKEASSHSLSFRMSAKLRNHAIYFRVIKEIINRYKGGADALFQNEAQLEDEVRRLLSTRYKKQGTTLRKSGIRAVSYILLTKILIAILIEFPYEKYILGSIDYFALGTNIVFHPLLLLYIVTTSKKPGEKNTTLIVEGVKSIVEGENLKPVHIKQSRRGPVKTFVFVVFYLALYALSFGAILYVLNALHFNIASIALFLFFVTLVSYFGFRLRYNAQRWTLSIGDEKISALLWDFFTFPIVRTGRWLSRRFSTINVFVLILDFLIETPFKFILGTFDSFVHYLRERKEDPL